MWNDIFNVYNLNLWSICNSHFGQMDEKKNEYKQKKKKRNG